MDNVIDNLIRSICELLEEANVDFIPLASELPILTLEQEKELDEWLEENYGCNQGTKDTV